MFPWDLFFQTLIIPVLLACLVAIFARGDRVLAFLASLKIGVGLWWLLWVAHVTVHMLNKYY